MCVCMCVCLHASVCARVASLCGLSSLGEAPVCVCARVSVCVCVCECVYVCVSACLT